MSICPDQVSMRHTTLLSAALSVKRGRAWNDAATIAPPTTSAAMISDLSMQFSE
jgi:hypothetical protein